jgi:hypothetical protein
MAGAFDCARQRPLVLGAGAGLSSGLDLAPVGDIAPQHVVVLVVDARYLVDAEVTDARSAIASPTAASSTTAPVATSTGPFFLFFLFAVVIHIDIFIFDVISFVKSFTLVSFVWHSETPYRTSYPFLRRV